MIRKGCVELRIHGTQNYVVMVRKITQYEHL